MPRLLYSIVVALVALGAVISEAEAARCSGCLDSRTTAVATKGSGLKLAPAAFATKASAAKNAAAAKKKKKKKKKRKPPPPPPRRRPPPPRKGPSPKPSPPPGTSEVMVLSPGPKPSPPPPPASPSPSPLPSPSPETRPRTTAPQVYTLRLLGQFPHDTTAYTQGLVYERRCPPGDACREVLWESTGLYGGSTLREVALANGSVLQRVALPEAVFGEGLAKIREKLYQLTWLSGKGYVYDARQSLPAQEPVEVQTPLADGWGAASDGIHLIVTDSSNVVTFLDPTSMQVVRQVEVEDEGRPVKWLNELEWIEGALYANVFQTECIAKIDPETGAVLAWVDARGLRDRATASLPADRNQGGADVDVLNGIAWDAAGRRMFVTGKLWPTVYHVAPVLQATPPPDALAELRAACIIDPDRVLNQ